MPQSIELGVHLRFVHSWIILLVDSALGGENVPSERDCLVFRAKPKAGPAQRILELAWRHLLSWTDTSVMAFCCGIDVAFVGCTNRNQLDVHMLRVLMSVPRRTVSIGWMEHHNSSSGLRAQICK